MYRSQDPFASYCSGGFIGYTADEWVMFTAGHCVSQVDYTWSGWNAYTGRWVLVYTPTSTARFKGVFSS